MAEVGGENVVVCCCVSLETRLLPRLPPPLPPSMAIQGGDEYRANPKVLTEAKKRPMDYPDCCWDPIWAVWDHLPRGHQVPIHWVHIDVCDWEIVVLPKRRKGSEKRDWLAPCSPRKKMGWVDFFVVLQSHCCVDVSDPSTTFVGVPACLW